MEPLNHHLIPTLLPTLLLIPTLLPDFNSLIHIQFIFSLAPLIVPFHSLLPPTPPALS